MSEEFYKWLEEQDRRELAIEFLWSEASLDVGIADIKKLDEGAVNKERFIKDSLLERIVNGSLFEPQFDKFLRERFEDKN